MTASTTPPLLPVVAAALVCDGRVLAARRLRPAGRWEFPGGKVEAGEQPATAVERELGEELAVRVRALREVARASDSRIELRLWHAELVDGEPTPGPDHDAVRWLGADDLEAVDWLAIDAALLDDVRVLLGRTTA